ncbi:hypothetical protein PGUG_00841 [Meyerozyma guilliermondii ATCC 6260]|uniref:YTH domain-containing protein n=1 Tax=Meyerozyma guilliermondii (strain ATCC 6260 / CBS 566 / DSM 6381 / JCM 1539 / NBRC 10279 / NRRL Y-324) TaxID=294746 RepID=A5DC36_PICGU|nr:uncharacterized protein PGUG_00841 [Meyerozyma guilliermondii ATCC 6260]EDK36743.2 hypothetical protein PGUG_00841 [Meyerozyma guilliermondii ATCC 6260]
MFSIDSLLLSKLGPFPDMAHSMYETKRNIWSCHFRSEYPSQRLTENSSQISQKTPKLPKSQKHEKVEPKSVSGLSLDRIPPNSRFFIIKSFTEKDVASSVEHGVWTSTDLGNKRLDKAYKTTSEDGGKVYLFFSVNGSGRFCGIAEMTAAVNFKSKLNIWNETSRWSGVFPITWVSTDSLPNRHFVQLRNPLNENKPITYSRDTQEVPFNIAFKFIAIYAKCDIYKRK